MSAAGSSTRSPGTQHERCPDSSGEATPTGPSCEQGSSGETPGEHIQGTRARETALPRENFRAKFPLLNVRFINEPQVKVPLPPIAASGGDTRLVRAPETVRSRHRQLIGQPEGPSTPRRFRNRHSSGSPNARATPACPTAPGGRLPPGAVGRRTAKGLRGRTDDRPARPAAGETRHGLVTGR